MKQIVVISGKGGTGKTVVTASFGALAGNLAGGEISPQSGGVTMADCDVDAADLHLLLKPQIKQREEFRSGSTAFIDKDKCNQCGLCRELCRFKAIGSDFVVDPVSCEGCAFCAFACPQKAIEMQENVTGEWFISSTRFGPLVHAKLGIAEENSGKLVSLVRKKAKEIAEKSNSDWIIIDGSPGIGCPVIASISGVDCALVVTEPTLSGLHDADRVIRVAKHFGIKTALVINKYDLNQDMAKKIENYCNLENIELLGKIPFDKTVVEAVVKAQTVIEYGDNLVSREIRNIWTKLKKNLLAEK
jgi:MinD superfamily P-loop ATPase